MKKLLLILLCFPLIGFGQDNVLDEIIFVNGDTIYGNVLEIGVKEVTYSYKNEKTNNVVKISTLAKILFSSGREQIFKGAEILKKRIAREKSEKQKKTSLREGKKWRMKIGGNFILPFKKTFDFMEDEGFEGSPITEITTKLGVSCQVSYILELNSLIAYSPSISYYSITLKKIERIAHFKSTLDSKHQYVGMTHNIQYKVNDKFTTSMGFSIDKLFKIKQKGEVIILLTPADDPLISTGPFTINNTHNTYLGFYISLPISVNYLLHENKHYNLSVYTDIKIPLYYSKNVDRESNIFSEDMIKKQKQENLLYNRNITIGLSITF
jgi:hypothetical protein